MILDAPDPLRYSGTVSRMIEKAATEPVLLGVLPPLARNPAFARMMLESRALGEWILRWPYQPEMRTFNVYMRNLLAPHSDRRAGLLVPDADIVTGMTHPLPAMRCAMLSHVRIMAEWFAERLRCIPRMSERLHNASMDSTHDESVARRSAIAALGLNRHAGPGPARREAEDMGPDVMVI